MEFSEDQISELKSIAPNLSVSQEGGFTYIRIENLKLPSHCTPSVVNALLCPMSKDGYLSSLFFSSPITGCPPLNWHRKDVRILGENWHAVSWRTIEGLRLSEMLQIHLSALR